MDTGPFLVVLGIAQDAGYPQPGCRAGCCQRAWLDPSLRRHPVSLGIVEPATGERWLLECSPAFPQQLRDLDQQAPVAASPGIAGILLTHAHIGHYNGLVYLGREAMASQKVPVYAMPKMRRFLQANAPWSQLVSLGNIEIRSLDDGSELQLSERVSITPMLAPHRSEYSETVGFLIKGPHRSALFLPDIDNWEDWSIRPEELLERVDIAYLDGTFYGDNELPGRDMSEIPHPLVTTSIHRFQRLSEAHRDKIRFIHFNHTNPLLDRSSHASAWVNGAGHHCARQGEQFEL